MKNVNNDLRNKQLWIQITTAIIAKFPKCQTHACSRFENGFSENSTQKLLTKYSTKEKNKQVICWPRSVRIGKNCARGLEWSQALLKTSGTVFPGPKSMSYISF